ncbi:MAG: paraquat-inducible protein A [Proteobacteria bacterium]|nr:paraquat-inducible protein A [Pseudomonadota bacterium]
MNREQTLRNSGLILCLTCHKLIRAGKKHPRCPRCGSLVHSRTPGSLSTTWALVITGFWLLIPANILPITQVVYLGDGQPDTIISGIISLINDGMLPIAILVFLASIVVPILKLLGISFLLLCVQFKWTFSAYHCTLLYRFISLIGRWSMLDLFMISILTALVDMGAVSSVTPGPGATAFATVVVITLFASKRFDPRLIWDLKET